MDVLPHAAALQRFLGQGVSALEGALIVARIVDADGADEDRARRQIDELANAIMATGDPTAAGVVAMMREQDFAGAGDNYYDVNNSVIDHVLTQKRGIPISLGVVAMGVAERLGLATAGVNFPRHFLITIEDELVDPYGLRVTSIEECRRWLKENRVNESGAFCVARPGDIVLRMLNNVRILLHRQRDFARALAISDYQLLIVPDHYGLYIERADAWIALGSPDMATGELEKALERAPSEAIANRLRDRINQSNAGPSVLN